MAEKEAAHGPPSLEASQPLGEQKGYITTSKLSSISETFHSYALALEEGKALLSRLESIRQALSSRDPDVIQDSDMALVQDAGRPLQQGRSNTDSIHPDHKVVPTEPHTAWSLVAEAAGYLDQALQLKQQYEGPSSGSYTAMRTPLKAAHGMHPPLRSPNPDRAAPCPQMVSFASWLKKYSHRLHEEGASLSTGGAHGQVGQDRQSRALPKSISLPSYAPAAKSQGSKMEDIRNSTGLSLKPTTRTKQSCSVNAWMPAGSKSWTQWDKASWQQRLELLHPSALPSESPYGTPGSPYLQGIRKDVQAMNTPSRGTDPNGAPTAGTGNGSPLYASHSHAAQHPPSFGSTTPNTTTFGAWGLDEPSNLQTGSQDQPESGADASLVHDSGGTQKNGTAQRMVQYYSSAEKESLEATVLEDSPGAVSKPDEIAGQQDIIQTPDYHTWRSKPHQAQQDQTQLPGDDIPTPVYLPAERQPVVDQIPASADMGGGMPVRRNLLNELSRLTSDLESEITKGMPAAACTHTLTDQGIHRTQINGQGQQYHLAALPPPPGSYQQEGSSNLSPPESAQDSMSQSKRTAPTSKPASSLPRFMQPTSASSAMRRTKARQHDERKVPPPMRYRYAGPPQASFPSAAAVEAREGGSCPTAGMAHGQVPDARSKHLLYADLNMQSQDQAGDSGVDERHGLGVRARLEARVRSHGWDGERQYHKACSQQESDPAIPPISGAGPQTHSSQSVSPTVDSTLMMANAKDGVSDNVCGSKHYSTNDGNTLDHIEQQGGHAGSYSTVSLITATPQGINYESTHPPKMHDGEGGAQYTRRSLIAMFAAASVFCSGSVSVPTSWGPGTYIREGFAAGASLPEMQQRAAAVATMSAVLAYGLTAATLSQSKGAYAQPTSIHVYTDSCVVE